jgi:class 3 adenylate cyclase
MKIIHGLVACSDLTGYARFAAKKADEEIFRLLSDYYEFVGEKIAQASGQGIKFMGDAALILFPEENADAGVRVLLALQIEGDRFLSERGIPCRHYIRSHFGPIFFEPIGTRGRSVPTSSGRPSTRSFSSRRPASLSRPKPSAN